MTDINDEHNCGHKGESADDWCNHDWQRFPDSGITPCDCTKEPLMLRRLFNGLCIKIANFFDSLSDGYESHESWCGCGDCMGFER